MVKMPSLTCADFGFQAKKSRDQHLHYLHVTLPNTTTTNHPSPHSGINMTSSTSPASTSLSDYLSAHPSFSSPTSASSPLPALYSDLSRQRKSNPSGFRASIDFWHHLLSDLAFQGLLSPDHTTLRLDETLKSHFTVDGVGRPLGLGTVVAELEKNGSLIEANAFLKGVKKVAGPQGRQGWRGYLPTSASAMVTTPVKWAATSIYTYATGGGGDEGEYSQDEGLFRTKRGDWVWYDAVHRLATAFLDHHYAFSSSPLDHLMTLAEFNDKLNAICQENFGFTPTPRDTTLVLKHLTRDCDGKVASSSSLVKFASTQGTVVELITDEDRSILAVTSTLRTLETQISALESQIASRTTQIKTALKANNKPQATSLLRSRRALEELLTKRLAAKGNIEAVVLKIEQALGDVEVMRGYEAANEALKGVMAREELRVENVEKVKEELEEGMASQREVDELIRAGGVDAEEEIDESEIQDELKALLEEKKREDGENKADKEADELMARFERLRVALAPLPSTDTPSSTLPDTERTAAAAPDAVAQ